MKRLVLFSTLFTCFFSVNVFAQSNTFPTSGNVGIGTTSPLANLDIVSGRSTLRVAGNSGADSWRARILLDRGDNYRGAGLWIQASAESELDWYAGVPYTGAGFSIGYHGAQPEYRANSKLFIKPDGKIGIGTTNPNSLLEIQSNNTSSELHLNAAGTTPGKPLIRLQINGINKWAWLGEYPHAGKTSFYSYEMASSIMTLTNGGNVGIGTITPGNKLEVNGTIRSKEVIVEATGWPDYVIEADYKLPTLAEIEAYIKAYNHLPGVPSAKQVEENGLTLGEMNALLLKKIEELTLHTIAIKKEVDTLKKENEVLKEKMSLSKN